MDVYKGEGYGHWTPPPFNMTVFDFLDFAKEMDVDGVSLESCFFPSYEDAFFADLKARLDAYGFDRVYAWGHPDGLEAGRNEDAFHDMIKSIEYAAKTVSYTHLRAHETVLDLVCRLLLEKKKQHNHNTVDTD